MSSPSSSVPWEFFTLSVAQPAASRRTSTRHHPNTEMEEAADWLSERHLAVQFLPADGGDEDLLLFPLMSSGGAAVFPPPGYGFISKLHIDFSSIMSGSVEQRDAGRRNFSVWPDRLQL
ncbi:hypothetical protein EYF80_064394 [Liparis tanakae]|uniref:Uncharacterized protein n=1 Tax=Liparis tanakae TaxID=230148 RepID=A0A4Z2EAA9_9TELE|nr:hypothetical protein EYF80_064394 [Liparis tanakae]